VPRPNDPKLTVQEATQLCGVSEATIRRRLRAGQLPGSARTAPAPHGDWLIPLSALYAAGLDPDRTKTNAPARPASLAAEDSLAELRAERDQLRSHNARLLDIIDSLVKRGAA
jgi:hypothetical protein